MGRHYLNQFDPSTQVLLVLEPSDDDEGGTAKWLELVQTNIARFFQHPQPWDARRPTMEYDTKSLGGITLA